MSDQGKFWETKRLSEMTNDEWESLCDGCGKCCLVKLQDDETEELYQTNVACWLFDDKTCQCKSYADRESLEPSCMILNKDNVMQSIAFAPSTCAYRLLFEGRPLLPWHPLITGDKNSVHKARQSVKNSTVSMSSVGSEGLESYVCESLDKLNDDAK